MLSGGDASDRHEGIVSPTSSGGTETTATLCPQPRRSHGLECKTPAVGPKQVLKLLPRPSPEAVGADDGAVDTVDAEGVIPLGDVMELLERLLEHNGL